MADACKNLLGHKAVGRAGDDDNCAGLDGYLDPLDEKLKLCQSDSCRRWREHELFHEACYHFPAYHLLM
jgi:hypothetical protein